MVDNDEKRLSMAEEHVASTREAARSAVEMYRRDRKDSLSLLVTTAMDALRQYSDALRALDLVQKGHPFVKKGAEEINDLREQVGR